jgi:hypothetical protein
VHLQAPGFRTWAISMARKRAWPQVSLGTLSACRLQRPAAAGAPGLRRSEGHLTDSKRAGGMRMMRTQSVSYGGLDVRLPAVRRKGFASIRLADGTLRKAELHWYEASGLGKFEFKIKRFVD